jgi:hypothetical protein
MAKKHFTLAFVVVALLLLSIGAWAQGGSEVCDGPCPPQTTDAQGGPYPDAGLTNFDWSQAHPDPQYGTLSYSPWDPEGGPTEAAGYGSDAIGSAADLHSSGLLSQIGSAIGQWVGMEFAAGLQHQRATAAAEARMTIEDRLHWAWVGVMLGTEGGGFGGFTEEMPKLGPGELVPTSFWGGRQDFPNAALHPFIEEDGNIWFYRGGTPYAGENGGTGPFGGSVSTYMHVGQSYANGPGDLYVFKVPPQVVWDMRPYRGYMNFNNGHADELSLEPWQMEVFKQYMSPVK